MRRKTEAEKLDPNVWFNNVERVAAARVGQEPVRYVRNIYKYYVAYKLIEGAEAAKKGAIAAAAVLSRRQHYYAFAQGGTERTGLAGAPVALLSTRERSGLSCHLSSGQSFRDQCCARWVGARDNPLAVASDRHCCCKCRHGARCLAFGVFARGPARHLPHSS